MNNSSEQQHEQQQKERRISVPLALNNVKPLSASGEEAAVQHAAEKKEGELAGFKFLSIKSAAADEFPKFLLNALVGEIETIGYNDSPFNEYINLEEPAWGHEAESKYLIVRHCYHDFLTFLSESFDDWQPGTQMERTITGTAGIGKTMFALYLARQLFDSENFVLLYCGQKFWAFTKNELAKKKKFNALLNKKTEANGTKIYYTSGTDGENGDVLNRMLELPHFITIRDCGKSEMKWLQLAKGRIVYVASSDQETFISLLENKSGLPSDVIIKYSDLWSALECAWSIKLGLLRLETKKPHVHGLDNSSLDVEYVLEAYRRYGGSIRNVLAFARELKLQNVEATALSNFPLFHAGSD